MRIQARGGRLGLAGGAVFLGAMTCAPGAPAQQAAVTSEPPGTLEDIIVTAEKRSESLEKVPLSIVAYTSESLSELGVQDFNALAARIPGVTLNSAGSGRSSYSIRGVASVGGNAPTTGLYVDETPILPSGGDGATAGIDPDLFDLARVEVLRGPQGTLYGASSMGGTVRFITNQPNLTKTEGAWEANLFVNNVFDKQAALSRFNSDNYDASTRSRIFTNRPRTAGLSLQWRF